MEHKHTFAVILFFALTYVLYVALGYLEKKFAAKKEKKQMVPDPFLENTVVEMPAVQKTGRVVHVTRFPHANQYKILADGQIYVCYDQDVKLAGLF